MVVAFGVFVAADDLMVVSTMLRPIIDDVGLVIPNDLDATAWIVNVYLIAYIAAIPIAGRLSDLFGRRAVFISALWVFLVGSVIVPSTDSFGVLLVGRALSAIGGGALVPVALAVTADLFTGGRRTRALGVLGAIETLGWVWGPLYGALLVRYLTWEWQFWLNVPLALIGMALGWRVLDPAPHTRTRRIDWWGAGLLTLGLIALNVALLSEARIQTISGLDQLTGGSDSDLAGPWLYAVALAAFAGLVWLERGRAADPDHEPVMDLRYFLTRRPLTGSVLNALVGAGVVVTLVNVPLFLNIVETAGIGRTALLAGQLLTAFTATMAAASYAGGRIASGAGLALPTVAGLVIGGTGLAVMGLTWDRDLSRLAMGVELAAVGAGVGLTLAPTSAALVDAADETNRGTAAGLVIMFRLMGFSVGLAGLTAWGLHRYNVLRADVVLPAAGEEGYETALVDAARDIGSSALAETFLGGALCLAVAAVAATGLRSSASKAALARVPRP